MEKLTKKCFKCGEEKPLGCFYKHPKTGDGYLNKCKDCTKKDVKKNIEENYDYYQAYERKRNLKRKEYLAEKCKKRKIEKPEEDRRNKKKWADNNKLKKAAHNKTRKAVLSGLLIRKPCFICGNQESETHHHDYEKPLDVVWLCDDHHKKLHILIRRYEEVYANPHIIFLPLDKLTKKERFQYRKNIKREA